VPPRNRARSGLACGLGFALVASSSSAAAAVRVELEPGGRVTLSADAAALADVLDGLASRLGIDVEYEGTPPRQLVTLELAARTPAEAVLSALEGQGLDFALQLDTTGRSVRKLFVTTASGTAPRPAPQVARPAPRRPPFRPPAPPVPDTEDYEEEEDPFEEDEEDFDAEDEGLEEEAEPAAGPPQTLPGPAGRPITLPTPRPPR